MVARQTLALPWAQAGSSSSPAGSYQAPRESRATSGRTALVTNTPAKQKPRVLKREPLHDCRFRGLNIARQGCVHIIFLVNHVVGALTLGGARFWLSGSRPPKPRYHGRGVFKAEVVDYFRVSAPG